MINLLCWIFKIFIFSLVAYGRFFPAATFFCCRVCFLGFWIYACEYWKFTYLHGLPDISIWGLESHRLSMNKKFRTFWGAYRPPQPRRRPNIDNTCLLKAMIIQSKITLGFFVWHHWRARWVFKIPLASIKVIILEPWVASQNLEYFHDM